MPLTMRHSDGTVSRYPAEVTIITIISLDLWGYGYDYREACSDREACGYDYREACSDRERETVIIERTSFDHYGKSYSQVSLG